jgi:hypothetical protein
MGDNDPNEKRKNELNPNTQLEKRPLDRAQHLVSRALLLPTRTGPFLSFIRFGHAAMQLHRTGLSLREQSLVGFELTVRGQSGLVQSQLLLMQHCLAAAALIACHCSISHLSSRSNGSTLPDLKRFFAAVAHIPALGVQVTPTCT